MTMKLKRGSLYRHERGVYLVCISPSGLFFRNVHTGGLQGFSKSKSTRLTLIGNNYKAVK